jgi:hypothetical protein
MSASVKIDVNKLLLKYIYKMIDFDLQSIFLKLYVWSGDLTLGLGELPPSPFCFASPMNITCLKGLLRWYIYCYSRVLR